MTPMPLITAPVGVSRDEALALLRQHKVEKLPLVDDAGRLRGLITVKDFTKSEKFPHATKDAEGRLVVGAAVGVGEDAKRPRPGAGRGRAPTSWWSTPRTATRRPCSTWWPSSRPTCRRRRRSAATSPPGPAPRR